MLSARVLSTTMAFGHEAERAMAFADQPENGVTLVSIQGAHTIDLPKPSWARRRARVTCDEEAPELDIDHARRMPFPPMFAGAEKMQKGGDAVRQAIAAAPVSLTRDYETSFTTTTRPSRLPPSRSGASATATTP